MAAIVFFGTIFGIVGVTSIVNGIVHYKKEKLKSAIRLKELELSIEREKNKG